MSWLTVAALLTGAAFLALADGPLPFGDAAAVAAAGPAAVKGAEFFAKWVRRSPFDMTVRQIGRFTEFAVSVPGRVAGSYTRWVKVVAQDGRTLRFYHDTYDQAARFQHRSIKVPGPERHAR